jgi:adenylate kinase family enzyme
VTRLVLLGNSGSGKSTLAARLAAAHGLAHLDLDTLAWEPERTPPTRRALEASARDVEAFMAAHDAWIIEGCYADLAAIALPRSTRFLFLNPGIDACIANAHARPWESHKYATKEEQDANLAMLLQWIRDYATRSDVFSLTAHRALFEAHAGDKIELASREAIARYGATGDAQQRKPVE